MHVVIHTCMPLGVRRDHVCGFPKDVIAGQDEEQSVADDGGLFDGRCDTGEGLILLEAPFLVGGLGSGSSLNGVGKAVFWVGLGSDRLGSSLL